MLFVSSIFFVSVQSKMFKNGTWNLFGKELWEYYWFCPNCGLWWKQECISVEICQYEFKYIVRELFTSRICIQQSTEQTIFTVLLRLRRIEIVCKLYDPICFMKNLRQSVVRKNCLYLENDGVHLQLISENIYGLIIKNMLKLPLLLDNNYQIRTQIWTC